MERRSTFTNELFFPLLAPTASLPPHPLRSHWSSVGLPLRSVSHLGHDGSSSFLHLFLFALCFRRVCNADFADVLSSSPSRFCSHAYVGAKRVVKPQSQSTQGLRESRTPSSKGTQKTVYTRTSTADSCRNCSV